MIEPLFSKKIVRKKWEEKVLILYSKQTMLEPPFFNENCQKKEGIRSCNIGHKQKILKYFFSNKKNRKRGRRVQTLSPNKQCQNLLFLRKLTEKGSKGGSNIAHKHSFFFLRKFSEKREEERVLTLSPNKQCLASLVRKKGKEGIL